MSGQLFSLATQTEWAILPSALETILDVLSRETSDLEAVAAKRAARMDNTDRAGIRDGVAVVPVIGPITRRASLFSDVSGLTSVDSIAKDFNAALSDPHINGILLDIDSPGGEVTGINELAAMFAEGQKIKPVVAYVGGTGASAAYWLASGAQEIVIDDTARLGSIGVVMAVPNPSARRASDLEFVSSQSPYKRVSPTTEAGKQKLQAHVDALAKVFIDAVARNRGVTAEQVESDFGRGGLLVGQAAVNAGLADRLGSFESTLKQIASGQWKPFSNVRLTGAASLPGAMEESEMNISDLKARILKAFEPDEPKAENKTPEIIPGKTEAFDDKGAIATERDARQKAEAEAASLRKRVADETAARVQAEANGFIDAAVLEGKLLPKAKESLLDEWLQAAGDDLVLPRGEGQPSRVERIKARISANESHVMFTEKVTDKGAEVLREKGAKEEVTPERVDALMNMTSLGQSALHAVK